MDSSSDVGVKYNPLLRQIQQRRVWWEREESNVGLPDSAPPEPEHVRPPIFRRIRRVASREAVQDNFIFKQPGGYVTPKTTREIITRTMMEYRQEVNPTEGLLLAVPAGVGKTFEMIRMANHLAAEFGDVTGFFMPRHEHMATVRGAAQHLGIPDNTFHHWLPIQGASGHEGIETCKFPNQRFQYVHRGYDGLQFCAQVEGCGFSYIKNGCVWHGQSQEIAQKGSSIICVQHQHLYLGHPLSHSFDVVMVDENPLGAASNPWVISIGNIMPTKLRVSERMRAVTSKLFQLAGKKERINGRALIDELASVVGGLDSLKDAIDAVPKPWDPAVTTNWRIRRPEDVALADYHYIPTLAYLLGYEVDAALDERPCAPRVWIDMDGIEPQLMLFSRARVPWRPPGAKDVAGYPPHLIVADATPGPMQEGQRSDLFSIGMDRPLRVVRVDVESQTKIYQVHSWSNNQRALWNQDQADKTTDRYQEVRDGVERVAKMYLERDKPVAIIGYKKMIDTGDFDHLASRNPETGEPMIGWFGASRGSNKYQPAHALLMVGIPQPGPDALHRLALCLFTPDQRTKPFTSGNVPARRFDERMFNFIDLDGSGVAIVTPTYTDSDLQIVHWQLREGEMIQAANRIRGVLAPEDDPKEIWIFSNLPVDELPPTFMVSHWELFDTPPSINPRHWEQIKQMALAAKERGYLSTVDIVRDLEVTKTTARMYLDTIHWWHLNEEGGPVWRLPQEDERLLINANPTRGRTPAFLVPWLPEGLDY